MSEIDKKSKDIWEEKLEIELKKITQCQQEKSLKSCWMCEKMFECEVRETYVKAVYESMNKGESGGFEF